ncbi:hypothetical protein DFH09DRAFT_1110396 [Mycena vulgaris]|nr:hypothetical protein DFH09DRAFT_1110396 [Mycena vulgaris]
MRPKKANLTERKAELQAKINDQAAELKASKPEYKLLTGTTSRSSGSSHKSIDTVVVSWDSCGRVKTAPLPKRVKDTAETSLATPILPINEADTNVEVYGMPGTDAMLPVSMPDATIRELPVPSAMLPSYVNDLSYNSGPPIPTEFSTVPMDCFGDLRLASNQQPNSAFDISSYNFDDSGYNFDFELFNMFGIVPENTAFSAEFHEASGSCFQPGSIADPPATAWFKFKPHRLQRWPGLNHLGLNRFKPPSYNHIGSRLWFEPQWFKLV